VHYLKEELGVVLNQSQLVPTRVPHTRHVSTRGVSATWGPKKVPKNAVCTWVVLRKMEQKQPKQSNEPHALEIFEAVVDLKLLAHALPHRHVLRHNGGGAVQQQLSC